MSIFPHLQEVPGPPVRLHDGEEQLSSATRLHGKAYLSRSESHYELVLKAAPHVVAGPIMYHNPQYRGGVCEERNVGDTISDTYIFCPTCMWYALVLCPTNFYISLVHIQNSLDIEICGTVIAGRWIR
jgi:hypothetical protein